MNTIVKETLDKMVEKLIYNEELPGILQKTLFQVPDDIPCAKWSIRNKIIMVMNGFYDARTFNAWKYTGRFVKKDEHAFYIMKPKEIQVERKKVVDEKEVIEEYPIVYFIPQPEFGLEQTEGKQLEYMEDFNKQTNIKELPLIKVAKKMNVNVKVCASLKGEYGSFYYETKEIQICTDSEQTFFHELSHAIDYELHPDLTQDTTTEKEVIAELSACFLASLYGRKANMKYTKSYIQSWSNKKHIGLVIFNALDRVKEIYDYIQQV